MKKLLFSVANSNFYSNKLECFVVLHVTYLFLFNHQYFFVTNILKLIWRTLQLQTIFFSASAQKFKGAQKQNYLF